MQRNLFSRAVGYVGLARHARRLKRDSDRVVRENSRLHVVTRLGKLRGLPQKIGQVVSMRGDDESAAAYEKLTDSSQPLPWKQVRKTLAKAWGCRVEKHVTWVDPEGFGASLGQVHKARLHDGREVAIKIQYPGIRQAVMNDLRMLGWLVGQAIGLPRDADFSDYRREVLRNLEEELDYRIEAEHQRRYRALACDSPGWCVPEVLNELSNEMVLTSIWETGERIDAAARWPEAERERLARILIEGFLGMLFDHGLLHADPHPGNYRFVRSPEGPKVVLYDFGSVSTITPQRRAALLKVLETATTQSGDPYAALVALDFAPAVLDPIRDRLTGICRTLFEPVWQPGKYAFESGRLMENASTALGDGVVRLWMSIPAHLLFIFRAFNGLRWYLDRLGAGPSWSTHLGSHLARQQSAVAPFPARGAS